MATSKSSSFKFNNLCKLLIKSVTGFNETDEHFEVCLDFAVSNLIYHTYTDVNSNEILRKISRLHEKFLIQSDLQKANNFQAATSQLISNFEKKTESEKEEGFKILSLILNLWNSSNESDECHKPSIPSISESAEESWSFDWSAYLHEDDINYNSYSDVSSELSQSDQSSENESPSNEDSLDGLPDPLLRPPTRDDSGLGISPDSCSGTSQYFHAPMLTQECLLASSKQERHALTFYPYWMPKYQKSYGTCQYNLLSMNFTKIWNDHIANQNLFSLIEKKTVLHERNVIKEILWMMCGVKDLFVAHWDGRKYIPYSQIHFTNLTSNSVYLVLNEFCSYATKMTLLQDFLYKTVLDVSQICHTYEAYMQSLLEILQKIQDSISHLDRILRKGDEIFTLLVLKSKMQPLFHEIDFIYNIHSNITSSINDLQKPFVKACMILHILWKLLYQNSLQRTVSPLVKILLKIFLKTCKPYFSFIEELMILGSFRDPYEEFLVKRENKQPNEETFWESGYSLRTLPRDLEDFFLKPFITDILCAGKSREILNTIYSLRREESFQLQAVKDDMYLKFIQILQKVLCRNTPKQICNSSKRLANLNKSEFFDPLLQESIFDFKTSTTKFFRPDINPAYRQVSPKLPECLYSEQIEKIQKILTELEPTRLKPLPVCIGKALNTCMEYAYFPVCRKLTKSLKEDHCIVNHLSVMRKYFLMESGDLMFSFYSNIFHKIFYMKTWMDGSFLYSALQNAIFEDKENSERLCIFLNIENPDFNIRHPLSHLSALKLSYKVDWPVSIMLGPQVQLEYSQIFSFLLQIKCAKYLLDNLYCTSLCKKYPQSQTQLMKALLKTKFPREQKIHGMYILRMRLMFFVNGFHNYIMTRILHSFGLEFMEVLENSRSVDEMIAAHADYLKSLQERCLLDRRISYLKEQIFQVLYLCQTFQQMWLKGVDKISLEDLQDLEDKFSKYSNFLLCCFNTPLRRGTYLHVENLVSTMLSNTHSYHVFRNRDL